jgi:hypothetical protein
MNVKKMQDGVNDPSNTGLCRTGGAMREEESLTFRNRLWGRNRPSEADGKYLAMVLSKPGRVSKGLKPLRMVWDAAAKWIPLCPAPPSPCKEPGSSKRSRFFA